MPSTLHEAIVALFQNRPALAGELLRRLEVAGAPSAELLGSARLGPTSLSEIDLRQYHVDGVVLFGAEPAVEGLVVVEVQLAIKPQKRWSWPVCLAHLRARHRCPVWLLVVALDPVVARWCARPIELGQPGWVLRPLVVGASAMLRVGSAQEARDNLELAVLAGAAYASQAQASSADETARVVEAIKPIIEAVLSTGQPERYPYIDLLLAAVVDPEARRTLEEWMSQTHEYNSELFRRLVQQGREEGRGEGKAEDILRVLVARGVEVPEAVAERIRSCRDIETLHRWLERAVVAGDASEVIAD